MIARALMLSPRTICAVGAAIVLSCLALGAQTESHDDLPAVAPGLTGTSGPTLSQLGYHPDDEKSFCWPGAPEDFSVLDESGAVVFQGRLGHPLPDESAGQKVRVGDFSALRKTGRYRVVLSGGQTSADFRIDGNVYADLSAIATHGLYLSRCGYAVQDEAVGHPACHLRDGEYLFVDGKRIRDGRDATGGWHDGGDYWRSTMAHAQAVSRLLWPLELFPAAFTKIPSRLQPQERQADWPDLVTEARWGLEWLGKMQNADGGISTGISPEIFKMPPMVPPEADPSQHYLGASNSSHTAKVGAVFARAARILDRYDHRFAQACLQRALTCWNFLAANPQLVAPKTITIYPRNEDAADRLWLAVELYRTTKEARYHDDFKKRFRQLAESFPPAPIGTQTIRNYNLHEALISYCFAAEDADPDIRAAILAGLRRECDRLAARSEAAGYGSVLDAENWRQRHTLGNALQMAWEMAMAAELTQEARYRTVALRQLQFVLGRNPLGKVFLTGGETNWVKHPHYRPVSISNRPPEGLLVKGPTHDADFLRRIYGTRPAPPPALAYVDEIMAHWCNEPDIEVQGHLIGLAAYFHAIHQAPSAR